MSHEHDAQLAETADRRWQLIAAAVLLMALKSTASAIMAVSDAPWVRYVDWFEAATAVGAALIAVWLVIMKFTRVPAHERQKFLNMEGFVATGARGALTRSWLTTFVLLTLLATAGDRWMREAPPEFFLQLALAMMLGVFSISFFVQTRTGGETGDV